MLKRILIVAAAAGCASLGFGQVTWSTSTGYGAGKDAYLIHPGISSGTYYVGSLHFTTTANDVLGTGTGHDIYTVCGDLDDVFAPPYTWNYTLSDSQAGSTSVRYGGNIVAGAGVEFGWTSLASLGAAGNHSTAIGRANANMAAGLQLAVWEAMYDFAADGVTASLVGTPDFGNGSVKTTTNLGSGYGSISYWANHFWQNILNDRTAVFIKAAPGSGGQDQFALYNPNGGPRFVTPEPFTMSLGIAAAGLFVRRRLKKA